MPRVARCCWREPSAQLQIGCARCPEEPAFERKRGGSSARESSRGPDGLWWQVFAFPILRIGGLRFSRKLRHEERGVSASRPPNRVISNQALQFTLLPVARPARHQE